MSAPRFTVITCTLDSEPWLPACIASVLAQRDADVEWIFVDGGSTDGSLARIEALAGRIPAPQRGPRSLRVLRDVRGGVARAMNAGLAAARGDIVAFLHADDFYLRDDVLRDVGRAFDDSGCRWLFGRTMRALGGRLVPEGYRAPRYSRAQLLRGNFIPHPATFVERRLMLEAGGFEPTLRYAMDYDLWLRLSRSSDPLQLDLPLVAFREHAGSLSTRERGLAMREDLQVRLRHAGPDPLARLAHVARHLIRRSRSRLRGEGGCHA